MRLSMRLAPALLISLSLALAPSLSGCSTAAPGNEKRLEAAYDLVPLQHAAAADVVERLEQLGALEPSGGYGEVRLAVDERTNSVMLNGQRGRLDQLIAVIQELDAPR